MDLTILLARALAHVTAAEMAADARAGATGDFWWRSAAVLVCIAGSAIPGTGVPIDSPGPLTCGEHLAAAAIALDSVPAADRPAGLLMARSYLSDAIRDVARLENVPGTADV